MSLSLLSMCERGLKRLQECWECYSDKLTETGVYQPLLSITAKLRRGAKPQLKVLMIVVVCIDWQNSFLQLFKPHKKALRPFPNSDVHNDKLGTSERLWTIPTLSDYPD